MKSRFQFYPQDELLIIQYEGIFNLEDYKNHIQKVSHSPDKVKIKRVLIDLQNIKIDQQKLIFNQIFEARKPIQKSNFKLAYIATNPKIVANLHLYIEKINNKNYQYFTTILAALIHLESNLSLTKAEQLLQQLRENN